jgi:hypothetical protein
MSSVRERMAVQAGQNRGLNTDHSHDVFGSLVVTNKVENASGISYLLRCTICNSSGQRVTQQQLENPTFVVKCANAGCGQTSAPRTYEANVGIQLRQDAISSPRQRADAAEREKAIAEMEGQQ